MHEKRYTELQHSKFTKSLFLANKCQKVVIIMFQMKNRTEWTFEFDISAFRNLLKDGCQKNNGFLTSKVSKDAMIRNRYNHVPHPTQDTNGKATNPQQDTTNESQEVSPFPAGDHKAQLNRRAQRHSKHKTEQKHKRSTKEVPPWNGQ